jgi:diguanylate cyclase (GGDEF)-like protein
MLDALLQDEEGRLAALHRLNALDTPAEEPFEKIVNLVRTVLSVPMATVTLVERDRQWFKAHRGMPAQETPRSISFCTHTIQERGALVVPDALLDPRFAESPLVTGAPNIRSYAGIPLRTPEGYNVGALCAIDTKPRSFSDAEIAILTNLASIVVDELELRLIAGRDHLTGALTRRGLMEQAEKELARYDRKGQKSACVLLDVDHFKSINDNHGHPAGDQVLRQLAEVCSEVMRPTDSFGRVGGEEFVLLLSDIDADGALAVAERFRCKIEEHPFDIGGGQTLKVTASFGVAPLQPGVTSVDAWLGIADACLYRAKRDGRNRTRLSS